MTGIPEMKVLFITRKFPPMVGGMEKVSLALSSEFSKKVETSVIAWGGSQKHLPWVLPKMLIQARYLIDRNKITHVHLGDALLAPLGWVLKKEFQVRVSVTVHGLDMTFKFLPYQLLIPWFVKRLDLSICVSRATGEECVLRGVGAQRVKVITNGVYPDEFRTETQRSELEKIVGEDLQGKKVLVTVGRLVPRKGVAWFVKEVMPRLSNEYLYLVVGEGKEKKMIEELIQEEGLEKKVRMLGRVGDEELRIIYNTADALVLPNRRVPGDMEGFGVVAIEASSTGLPVLASRLEGIVDAVKEGKNGLLVKEGEVEEWLTKIKIITQGSFQRSAVRKWTVDNFSWEKIGDQYLELIQG